MSLSAALIALEFLTPLRLRRVERWSDRGFGEALGWFPLIGLLLGALLLGIDRTLAHMLPSAPTSALLVAALALLSGGLHLDGVADTADGMAVQGDRATRLGVMSAGNIGPAGVMALALVLLVQWSAFTTLDAPMRSAAILISPALSRWSATPVAVLFRPARPRGIGHALQQGIWPVAAPLGSVLILVACLVLFGPAGVALPIIAGSTAVIVAAAAARLLDGVTGDTFGAAIEVSQSVVLLFLVACAQRGWLTPNFLG
jgi:adenosylcobinamide-GDP ribazoletransferase